MEVYRYVIKKDDGRFYWKANVSSLWGLHESFDDAYLFKTELSAKQRIKSANLQNCKVRKVKIELLEE